MNSNNKIELSDDIQLCLICSIRYALGRKTYMPSVVQKTLEPILPMFTKKNLKIILNDLHSEEETPGFFGDEEIDRPGWMRFMDIVQKEYDKRD